jgi:carbamoyl-phosphate synthase large subunit
MNILLTSVGRRRYIVEYFIEALQGNGSVHVSNSHYVSSMMIADGHLLTPLIYDDSYIDVLISYCKLNNIDTILTLFDIDLLVLSENEDRFLEIGVQLLLASAEMVRNCNDKLMTYNLLREIGLDTPKTYVDIDEVKKNHLLGLIHYPLIVKPRWGMASIGLFKVENDDELLSAFENCMKAIMGTHLKYESNLTQDAPIVIQEYIDGKEYGLDVLNDLDCNYVCVFAKWKKSMRSGETDVGVFEDATRFNEIAKRLSEVVKHKALLSVDCIVRDDQVYVIELNCRISGHYPVSHVAGVNVIRQIVRWRQGLGTDQDLLKGEVGSVMVKDINPVRLLGSINS